jgi:hypothetical protein
MELNRQKKGNTWLHLKLARFFKRKEHMQKKNVMAANLNYVD